LDSRFRGGAIDLHQCVREPTEKRVIGKGGWGAKGNVDTDREGKRTLIPWLTHYPERRSQLT
jgi:hypothetical protein